MGHSAKLLSSLSAELKDEIQQIPILRRDAQRAGWFEKRERD